MRLIFGIILGIAITIGAAYVRDSGIPAATAAPGTPPADISQRPVVNWDVFGAITRAQIEFARRQWDNLFSQSAQR